jgi:hypothetical protein
VALASYAYSPIGLIFMAWTGPLLHWLTFVEPWLNLMVLLAALKMGVRKRFPAMVFYLYLRLFSGILLLGILNANYFSSISPHAQSLAYICCFWPSYIAGAVAIVLVVQEIFMELTRPILGLQRFGLIAFRWVAAASVVIALGTIFLPGRGSGALFSLIAVQVMRCASVMELCLLTFLGLTIHSLGRSFRSPLFGIGLGLGIQAFAEMVSSGIIAHEQKLDSPANCFLEIVTLMVFMLWTAYFLLPEPVSEKRPATLPVTSPLIRWNEIAKALGHSTPHVAIGQPAQTFFLQDVEKVVDKILTKNSVSL